MIVEDDFSTRRNVVQLLSKSGYKVLSAENGEEALRLLENCAPDLIISDVVMPGMDGYELCRRVNAEEKEYHIPFIFLTGKTEISDFREGMETGADDYLTKPFKAKDVLKSVEVRLKKKEKSERNYEQFKNRIIRNVSHEFRTPLVPILGYSQMIKENFWQLGPAEVQDMNEKIQSSGAWMLKLIEKFLYLAELEENIRGEEDNYAFLKETVYTTASRIAAASRREDDLQFAIGSAAVNIPARDLERILTELLENACRFSCTGTPVEITSRQEDGCCILSITDHGKGMTQEQLKSISSFLQFGRDEIHHAGLGLGLTIVKKIAAGNDLNVSIESVYGEYTKVTLTLPLWLK